ncbi:MAG: phospholipase [Parvibaculum sp.]|uniref:alpha/beta hydrolase n=1 Tax=Parvibaculum sp. TaxID=2024848 RepID=UPI00284ACD1D|nr:phospholipase [Parvibaculum sp.]MDR3498459.1 phospholipase [Parvibaculum sp.]
MTLNTLRRDPAEPAEWLVVFLHGYGSSGADLMAFADYWQGALPNVAFVAPDGPTATKDGGFQWIGKRPGNDPRLYDDAVAAQPAVDEFIDGELARLRLDATRLALVGFSQGTVMALHTGLRRPQTPAAILGYAGGLVGRENLAADIASRPPVMLINGELDELAPVYGMHVAVKALTEAGVVAAGQVMPNLGHAVDADALIIGARFLLSAFAHRAKHGVPG